MLKPLLVAVFLTGLLTPAATAVPAPTCLEPPTSDKTELCVELVSYEGKEFAADGRFASATPTAPATLRVFVQQRMDMLPRPITITEKTVTGTGELKALTDPGRSIPDVRTVRACAYGWTDIGAQRHEVCTPWQGV
ncbi:hypothetical protein ACFFQW_48200 [Umezawaea endophytica]|uniref:Uncharacterized protein n=1 Tax=Umezawaea endophytica TaxID=1654476 RepID=A0A9X2VVY3_9PSEU|nr:hypothetical protein [Umezawaea endophytica]MCS7483664.1 hypothetical protein [Umezawaea endophytica]